MKRTEIYKGINAKMENRLDHNTLNTNLQIGDNNNEETENVNIDDNEEKDTTIINGGIHIHDGGFQINQKLDEIGGSAHQNSDTKNVLTTDHAIQILFGLIGVAVVVLAIGISISCIIRKQKKRNRKMKARIQKNTETMLMKELNDLKEKFYAEQRIIGHKPRRKFHNSTSNHPFHVRSHSKNETILSLNYTSCSNISEI